MSEAILTLSESTIEKLAQLIQEEVTLEDPEAILEEIRVELLEEITRKLLASEDKKLLRRPRVRRAILEKCGKKVFLLPEELKFPIVRPTQALKGKCEPSCELIFAAYLRANEWSKKKPEYKKIAEKAKELYTKLKCADKIKVHINEETVSLPEFIEIVGL